jgi:hypothetical protein
MLHNLDTIYDIARSSKNFSTEINFSENIFLVYRGWWENFLAISSSLNRRRKKIVGPPAQPEAVEISSGFLDLRDLC